MTLSIEVSPADLTPAQIREYAVAGARSELEAIFAAFPELRAQFIGGNGARPAAAADEAVHVTTFEAAAAPPSPTVKRAPSRRMSAAARLAISKRMRAYWAARRAERR